MYHRFDRRRFLKICLAGLAGARLTGRSWAGRASTVPSGMPKRPLGGTGHAVSLFSLGGESTIERSGRRDEALDILHRAIDLGVNYIDTSPTYGHTVSERHIGEVMAERRNEVFLATKTHDRTHDGTMRLFEASLNRLQTDHLDLYQIHNVRTARDIEQIFRPDGAVRALESLRDQKAIRFTGITGHRDPDVLRRGIEQYDFDCVLMALNAADTHYASFQERVLPAAVERGMGIIAMKVPALGRILRPDGIRTMAEALGYVYSLPISTAIVGISTLEELEENVEITRTFEPFDKDTLSELAERTAHYHEHAAWFKYHW